MTEREVHRIYAQRFGTAYSAFAAPGRINVIGEHTDYNLGFVLPASIDRQIYLAIAPSADGLIRLTAADFGQSCTIDPADASPALPHWAKYPYGVFREIQALGLGPQPFQAVFGGDIPEGAGLSSSAALECVFALALNTLNGLGLTLQELARIGQRAEHRYAGVRCGIMDQFASLFGQPQRVIRLDCRSLEYEHVPFALPGISLVLADTRVKHSLAASEYNTRRAECEEGVGIIAQGIPGVRSLRDVTPAMMATHGQPMSPKVRLRCEYVVEENIRLHRACDALQRSDAPQLGQLMYGSHVGLRDKYQVSCPELDLLVDTAATVPGVHGARMMGGGFGGCTLNLVASEAVGALIAAAEQAFGARYGQAPLFYRVAIGAGASPRAPLA